jgi:predicted permease
MLIYLWGVPRLLIADSGKKHTFRESLKSFVNPMFIAMLIGILVGLFNIRLPEWTMSIINVSGDCMSPIAMILTGVVVSSISLKGTLTNVRIYIVSIIRLIIMPVIAYLIVRVLLQDTSLFGIVFIMMQGMPAASVTVIVSQTYNSDVDFATKGVMLSTVLCLLTLPIFALIL